MVKYKTFRLIVIKNWIKKIQKNPYTKKGIKKNIYFLNQDFYCIFSLTRICRLTFVELSFIYSDSLLIEIGIISLLYHEKWYRNHR